ncbi:MAG: type II secretion system protein [Candidatus Sumerlaeia bacterium]
MIHRRPTVLRRGAFVLLEVIVSLTILGMAVAALMRSFTQSFRAARIMEIETQASFLAQQLMDEFEVYPPMGEKVIEAGFGAGYPEYSYRVEKKYVEPHYKLPGSGKTDIEQFFAMRQLTIEIHYQDEAIALHPAIRVRTAIVGFEKFSTATKASYSTEKQR